MSDRAKKLQDPGPHRHGVERERAASAAVAHSLAEIGGVPHAPCRNETPPDRKLNSLASFKSAMVDQLDSVYGLALAVTQSPAKAEELSFLSFAQALDEIKAQGVVSSAPRQLLFR